MPREALFADYVSREVEWYSDAEERVLGIVLLDLQDNDWLWMVLGRDEAGLFRAIALDVSIPTQAEAKTRLMVKLERAFGDRPVRFPTG